MKGDILDDDGRGVWIGAVLLLAAFVLGILIGVAVMGPISDRAFAAKQSEREMVQGRVSDED